MKSGSILFCFFAIIDLLKFENTCIFHSSLTLTATTTTEFIFKRFLKSYSHIHKICYVLKRGIQYGTTHTASSRG